MSDLISRQAAIDALNEVSEHYTEKGREWHPHISFMIEAIKEVPSAQPNLQPTCNRLATDCISRQAAIDAIDKIFPVKFNKSRYEEGVACGAELAIEYIRQLPSAQPERKQGKIKMKDVGLYKRMVCDQCEGTVSPRDNYCRWCGADMREVRE